MTTPEKQYVITQGQIDEINFITCEYFPTSAYQTARAKLQSLPELSSEPAPNQPEDDGSDWFYKLKFICRVLEGSRFDIGDTATALGMARSLLAEKHTEGMALQHITEKDVTDGMMELFDTGSDPYIPVVMRSDFVRAVNIFLSHRSIK